MGGRSQEACQVQIRLQDPDEAVAKGTIGPGGGAYREEDDHLGPLRHPGSVHLGTKVIPNPGSMHLGTKVIPNPKSWVSALGDKSNPIPKTLPWLMGRGIKK